MGRSPCGIASSAVSRRRRCDVGRRRVCACGWRRRCRGLVGRAPCPALARAGRTCRASIRRCAGSRGRAASLPTPPAFIHDDAALGHHEVAHVLLVSLLDVCAFDVGPVDVLAVGVTLAHGSPHSRCGRSSPPFPDAPDSNRATSEDNGSVLCLAELIRARGVCHAIRCGIPGWWATRCVRCQWLGGRVHVDLVDVRAGLATSKPGHGVDARHPSDVDPRCTAGVKAVRPARPRKQVGSGVMPGMIRVLPARAP